MIHDIEMRWVLRWWWGIVPYWKLQHRKLSEYRNSGAHSMGAPNGVALGWSKWEDVNEGKEDA